MPHFSDAAAPPIDPELTHVQLVWIKHRKEYWLRFGASVQQQIIDRTRRSFSFAPGAVFALVRWEANDYGTVFSRIDIARAAGPGVSRTFIPFVQPGAISLLSQSGWPKVKTVLAIIDAIARSGIALDEVSPDYWRHVHNRMAAGEQPREYSRLRHRAWLLRREIAA